ncbi:MAG: nuclear transport factor 2 family protein [Phycisphaeraceae bacterium]|nr:MAG: nuclear transport factor 2 family protein [Phycisphaeraceae bacterium]
MFNRGLFAEIEDTWWDKKKIASVEGHGVGMAWVGLKAVRAKNDGWVAEHAIHGASAEGPFVGSTGFTVRFKMDVETKATGQRQVMDEVGVYTVENGKIVREEFMYLIP